MQSPLILEPVPRLLVLGGGVGYTISRAMTHSASSPFPRTERFNTKHTRHKKIRSFSVVESPFRGVLPRRERPDRFLVSDMDLVPFLFLNEFRLKEILALRDFLIYSGATQDVKIKIELLTH